MDIKINAGGVITLDQYGGICVNDESVLDYIKEIVKNNCDDELYKTLRFAGSVKIVIEDLTHPIEVISNCPAGFDHINELNKAMGVQV